MSDVPASTGRSPLRIPVLSTVLALVLRLRRYRFGTAGLVLFAILTLVTVIGPVLWSIDASYQDYSVVSQAPSLTHPFGTDALGRDLLSRVIAGARVSLLISVSSVSVAVVAGTTLGLVAGYRRGWFDRGLSLLIDAALAFPIIILALAVASALGPSLTNLSMALGVVFVPTVARLVRGEAISLREREYVDAARSLGATEARVMLHHILPNVVAPVLVMATLLMAYAIQAEAGLSFLGLGVRPPTPAWGSMIRESLGFMEQAPWMMLAPGGAIVFAVYTFISLGDALREALDPRVRPDA